MKRLLKWVGGIVCAFLLAFGVSWAIYMPDRDERGVWRHDTGGSIIQLGPFKATLYSESSHSCYQNLVFPAHLKLVELLEGARINASDDRLTLWLDGSLDPQTYTRISALPENCGEVDPAKATPRDVFDATWAAMNAHYAFFDLHGVDWAARQVLAPPADTTMADAEIMTMLETLTAGLDDGHVHFGSSDIGWGSPAERPAWMPADGSINRTNLRDIARAHAGVELMTSDTAPIEYGLRPDGIGYIIVHEMDVSTPIGGTSETAMQDAFGAVLNAMPDARALVVDVRYNPGGSDSVSFGIASHFTGVPIDVFTKTTRDGDGQTAPFTAVLQPLDATPDQRPVVVLTSRLTGSAAEIFTIAMRELDQVTTMGEPTSGGLSDVLGFVLPNGWGLGLSHQTYLTMDGELFEKVGVRPDIPVTFETSHFQAGDDQVLAAAFAYLNQ